MKSLGGVELLGSIAIVANLVFMNDFMGWAFAMVDCIFYMYRGENLYYWWRKYIKLKVFKEIIIIISNLNN
jgi:hypothetical protein